MSVCVCVCVCVCWTPSPPPGKLKDVYKNYRYTYQACGAILVVSSVYLFVAMGFNYHMLDKEKREEERRAVDQEANAHNASKEKEAEPNAATPLTALEIKEDTV